MAAIVSKDVPLATIQVGPSGSVRKIVQVPVRDDPNTSIKL